MDMERFHLYLSARQREKLQALSDETGLSLAEHVRRAVDMYLKAQEKDQREDR